MKSNLLWTLLIGATTGCYRNTIGTELPPSHVEHEEVVQFFLWGLVGEKSFDMNRLCPTGVSRIYERQEVPEVLFNCVTLGIYTPVRVTLTCADGKAWLLEPLPEQGLTMVESVANAQGVMP